MRSIGSDAFRAWVDDLYQKRVERSSKPEDASFRHQAAVLPVAEVLSVLGAIFAVDAGEFARQEKGVRR